MKGTAERLLGFFFCAIVAGYAVNILLDAIHHRFSQETWFQTHWVIFYVLIPTVLLLALAWAMGFFRPGRARWGDAVAVLFAGLTVYLMLGAGYSCWKYCF